MSDDDQITPAPPLPPPLLPPSVRFLVKFRRTGTSDHGLPTSITPRDPWYSQIEQYPTHPTLSTGTRITELINTAETRSGRPQRAWEYSVWIVWDMPNPHKKKAKTLLGPWGDDTTQDLLQTMASRKARDYLKVKYCLA